MLLAQLTTRVCIHEGVIIGLIYKNIPYGAPSQYLKLYWCDINMNFLKLIYFIR